MSKTYQNSKTDTPDSLELTVPEHVPADAVRALGGARDSDRDELLGHLWQRAVGEHLLAERGGRVVNLRCQRLAARTHRRGCRWDTSWLIGPYSYRVTMDFHPGRCALARSDSPTPPTVSAATGSAATGATENAQGTPLHKIALTALAREHLDRARRTSAGRSAETTFGGHAHTMRQTLGALSAETTPAEHEMTPEQLRIFRGILDVPVGNAELVRAAVPTLGTDGYGLSDTREELRALFHTDADGITTAALSVLGDRRAWPAARRPGVGPNTRGRRLHLRKEPLCAWTT